jgi:hypothetical protein
MVDDSNKIRRVPYPIVGVNRIKGLKKRREGKEEDEFNEYVKDTIEKEKSRPSLNPDEKEHSKDVENDSPADRDEGSKIDIIV